MSDALQNIGAIGESTVITELLWHGWAPANLNAHIRNAPNVDILAAKDDKTVALQVKTSVEFTQHVTARLFRQRASV